MTFFSTPTYYSPPKIADSGFFKIASQRVSRQLSDAFPFGDTATEKEFCFLSTQALVRRLPAIFIFSGINVFCVTLQLLPYYDGIIIPVVRIIATLCVFSLAFVASWPSMQTQHARALELAVEVAIIVFVPAFIVTTPSLELSTFLAMGSCFLLILILRPRLYCVVVATVECVIAWAVVGRGLGLFSPPFTTSYTPFHLRGDALVLAISIVLSGFGWILSHIEDRRNHLTRSELQRMFLAKRRILSTTLPHEILAESIGRASLHAPATAEPDVTIIFVRLPELVHPVFPTNVKDAVVKLNVLWAMCDTIMSSHGVTILEVTGMELIACVGLRGNGTSGTADAMTAVAASLAIIAALPPEFAAVVVIGIHSGTVSAGFLGELRPKYTLIGDTMNTASRMASAAISGGSVTVSNVTYSRVVARFKARERVVIVKGKGTATVFDIITECGQTSARIGETRDLAKAAVHLKASSSPTPEVFTLLDGFTDVATEKRFGQYTQLREPWPWSAIVIMLICEVLYVLANNNFGTHSSHWRYYLDAALIASMAIPWASAIVSPWSTAFTYILCALTLPFVAQDLRVACLASSFFFFIPFPSITTLNRCSLNLLRVISITILQSMNFYQFREAHSSNPSPILWMWLAWLSSSVGYTWHLYLARERYANTDVLNKEILTRRAILLHLLPSRLVDQLTEGIKPADLTTVSHDVALLSADIVGFTALSASAASPTLIFDKLNRAHREFERVAHAEGASKVKTVGDCIIFAAGLRDFPTPTKNRAERVALLARVALGIHEAAAQLSIRVRIGILYIR